MDQLKALKYFIKVVETGSFTKAAAYFNVPPSSLSRRVADLEASLGATLLKRSTRVVKLTEIGESYYKQVQGIVADLEFSNEAVRSYQSQPMGKLKISAMVGFGEHILLPLLDEFTQLYPDIVLDVHLSDELSALGRDDIDIAIRGGYAPNERVVAIRLMENYFIPVAAPTYLETNGVPKHPSELKHHKGLFYRAPNGYIPWLSEIDGQWQDISPPAAAISNAGEWLVEKAIKGEGILMLPRWVLKEFLANGELEEIFFEPTISITPTPDFAIYLLYQKQRYHVPKVRAAVDFIVDRVKGSY
ncbi:MAG: LysR substrate-binding domain-containing protein [Pseudomonadales bacterium]|nr:LysR substrate-binding domain-containing protein [Pseudomonadales bacterium]